MLSAIRKLKILSNSVLFLLSTVALSSQTLAQGIVEQISLFSPALENNLNGDDPQRDIFVYLPPGYEDGDQRYPVIYFLHGYAVGAPVYVEGVLNLPESVNDAIAQGADEAIIVVPNAFNRYGGSMYSNSPTIGDWESFVARDLVSHIDSHYRTLAKRESRGLAGHSMGGYGTLRIGMKHPDVFAALYAMSACCLMNQAPGEQAVATQLSRMEEGLQVEEGTFSNSMQAQAAAWAPNPQNPPYYFDLPYQDGEPLPLVQGKWTANSLLITVDQHVPALKQYEAILIDVGDEDGLEATNTQMAAALSRLEVAHHYEVYAGDHGNRIGQRFVDELLPFFSQHLQAE